jgi:hypothetical protein
MSYGIGFKKAWAGLVPLVCEDRYLFSQEGSWFGSNPPSFFIVNAGRVEKPVYRSRRDTQKGLRDLRGEITELLAIPWEPERYDHFQPF